MSHCKGPSPSPVKIAEVPRDPKAKPLRVKVFYAFAVFVILFLLFGRWGGNANNANGGISAEKVLWDFATAGEKPVVCADTSLGLEFTAEGQAKKIKLNEMCWTGEIIILELLDFKVNTTGDWLEYRFWDGSAIRVEKGRESDFQAVPVDDFKMRGSKSIRGSKFQLRGNGVATIIVGPMASPTIKKEPEAPREDEQKETEEAETPSHDEEESCAS